MQVICSTKLCQTSVRVEDTQEPKHNLRQHGNKMSDWLK